MSDRQQPLSLDTLGPQIQSTIVSINSQGPVRRRLMDMGLTPGTKVVVEGTAPLGDPIILWVRGCRLALRRLEAAQISVEPCPGTTGGPNSARGRHRHRWGQRGPWRRYGWQKGQRDTRNGI